MKQQSVGRHATPLSLIGTLLTFSGLTYLSEISFSIANQSLIYLSILEPRFFLMLPSTIDNDGHYIK
jgi:hypothetical protein